MSTKVYPGSPVASSASAGSVTSTTIGDVNSHIHRRISWAAIFGGVILTIAIQLLLSMLGLSIGLRTVNVNAGTTPDASSLGVGAGIWWVLSSCIALFLGGYIAAWLAGIEIKFDGLLHGLMTWSIATVLTLYLLTSAIGSLIGGGFSAVSRVANATGSGLSSAATPLVQAAGVTPDMLRDQAKAFMQPTNPDPATMTPQDAQKEIAENLVIYERGGADASTARERIITIMAAQMKISHGEAEQRFNDTQAKLQQTKDQVMQSAKKAADASAAAASTTSFATFVVLLLGAAAAAFGGSLAVERRLLVAQRVTA